MSRIAILYATTEGQTAKIAHHIGDLAKQRGLRADVLHLADLPESFELDAYDATLIGASIHEGHHQRYARKFIEKNRVALARKPSAQFTVCMAIASPFPEERAEAEGFPIKLEEETGFHPDQTAVFAGALMYTKYSWLKRALMAYISRKERGATDVTKDHEYTDWAEVDRFALAFFDRVQPKP